MLLAVFLLFLCLIYMIVVVAVLWYKAWAAIQDRHARTTPGLAVGLCFIPLFNLYWIFHLIYGFAKDYNAFLRRYNLPIEELPEGYFLTVSILTVLSIILNFIPIVGILYSLMMLVLTAILLNKVCNAVNALVDVQLSVKNIRWR